MDSMPCFVVREICFLLSGNDEEILYGSFDEGGGGIYDINFFRVTTRRISFANNDIEVRNQGWCPSLQNNFLQPFFRFVVVRFNHDEKLVRISLSSRAEEHNHYQCQVSFLRPLSSTVRK
jgi:hypothetical protein